MQISIEKRHLFILLALIIFLAGVILVIAYTQQIPNPGHGGDTILIKNSTGEEKTLQSSIDQGDFRGSKGDTGPQGPTGLTGPQGPQGPAGPAVTTVAVCSNGVERCSCVNAYEGSSSGPCTVTSDTGSCSSSATGGVHPKCCVCKPG